MPRQHSLGLGETEMRLATALTFDLSCGIGRLHTLFMRDLEGLRYQLSGRIGRQHTLFMEVSRDQLLGGIGC